MENAGIVLSDILMLLALCGGFSIHHYMVKYYSKILEDVAPGAEAWHERYGYGFGAMVSDIFRSVNV